MNKAARVAAWKWERPLALIASGFGVGWSLNDPTGSILDFGTVPVSRGNVTRVVPASGQLTPVLRVEVGSQISGIIEKLFADFNSLVKEGQLIAQLDPATYEANLIQAQGNLANVKAGLELTKLSADRAKVLQAD